MNGQPMYIGNENKVKLLNMKDDTGAYINTAVVTFSINRQADGSVVTTGTCPSIDALGNYSYTLPASQVPAAGHYDLVIIATVGGTVKLTLNDQLTVLKRGNS